MELTGEREKIQVDESGIQRRLQQSLALKPLIKRKELFDKTNRESHDFPSELIPDALRDVIENRLQKFRDKAESHELSAERTEVMARALVWDMVNPYRVNTINHILGDAQMVIEGDIEVVPEEMSWIESEKMDRVFMALRKAGFDGESSVDVTEKEVNTAFAVGTVAAHALDKSLGTNTVTLEDYEKAKECILDFEARLEE